MKNRVNCSYELVCQNALFMMSVYISTLAKSDIDYFDLCWKDNCMHFQSICSTDGIICFDSDKQVVGALRTINSDRLKEYPEIDAQELFAGASDTVQIIARQKVLESFKLAFTKKKAGLFTKQKTISVPVATTVFWNENSSIFSCDDNDTFMKNGGKSLTYFNMSKEELYVRLMEEYCATKNEMDFAEYLFQIKTSEGSKMKAEKILEILKLNPKNNSVFKVALDNFGIEIV